jgi:hypothetical protein
MVAIPRENVMSNVTAVTEEEMLLNWAVAEIPEEHRQRGAPARATADLRERIARGRSLDVNDRSEIRRIMHGNRSEVAEFLDGRTQWYRADIELPSTGDVSVDAYWLWTALGACSPPSAPWREPHPRTIRELAIHPDMAELTITGEFDFAKMRGCPILIGTTIRGPWRAVEGSNRLVGMWRAREAGRDLPRETSVFLGVHPDATKWKLVDLWLALDSLGWRPGYTDEGVWRARDATPERPFALACPNTRRVAPVSEETYARLGRMGVPELRNLRSSEWEWVD